MQEDQGDSLLSVCLSLEKQGDGYLLFFFKGYQYSCTHAQFFEIFH